MQSKLPYLLKTIGLLIFIAMLPLPAWYYTLLRISVFILGIASLYLSDKKNWKVGVIIGLCVLYNPIIPIYFSRDIWAVLNLITGVLAFFISASNENLSKSNFHINLELEIERLKKVRPVFLISGFVLVTAQFTYDFSLAQHDWDEIHEMFNKQKQIRLELLEKSPVNKSVSQLFGPEREEDYLDSSDYMIADLRTSYSRKHIALKRTKYRQGRERRRKRSIREFNDRLREIDLHYDCLDNFISFERKGRECISFFRGNKKTIGNLSYNFNNDLRDFPSFIKLYSRSIAYLTIYLIGLVVIHFLIMTKKEEGMTT